MSTHPIDQVDNAGKRKRIVKFTSDSFKETERKTEKINCGAKKKKQQINVGIKF